MAERRYKIPPSSSDEPNRQTFLCENLRSSLWEVCIARQTTMGFYTNEKTSYVGKEEVHRYTTSIFVSGES